MWLEFLLAWIREILNSEQKRERNLLVRPEREIALYMVLKYFITVPSYQAMNRWTIYGEMGKTSINLVNSSCFAVAVCMSWFSLQPNSMHMSSSHRVPDVGWACIWSCVTITYHSLAYYQNKCKNLVKTSTIFKQISYCLCQSTYNIFSYSRAIQIFKNLSEKLVKP